MPRASRGPRRAEGKGPGGGRRGVASCIRGQNGSEGKRRAGMPAQPTARQQARTCGRSVPRQGITRTSLGLKSKKGSQGRGNDCGVDAGREAHEMPVDGERLSSATDVMGMAGGEEGSAERQGRRKTPTGHLPT